MRQFYLDTNVFIAQLKPDDPYHSEATIIAQMLKEDEIQAETSVLTIVKTASVASRLYYRSKGGKGTDKERKAFITRVIRRLGTLKIMFIHIAGDSPIPFRNIQVNMPEIFNEAILMILQTPLRTFDQCILPQ